MTLSSIDLQGPIPAFQSGERILVATSTAGLCNRLLNLAGCLRLAELTGRRLVLYWPLDWNLNCPFSDLFENPIERLDERHVYNLLHTQNAVTVYQTSRAAVNRQHYRRVVKGDDAQVIVVKGWGAPGLRLERPGRAERARPYLKSLVPVAALRARIAAEPALEQAIGVHVRRVAVPDSWAAARDDDYLTILRRILDRRPDLRFHLATDDLETERRFREALGDRIHTLEKGVYGPAARLGREGMQDAVVELYRLARTRAILGSDHSTFSSVAALLGSGRLVIAGAKSAGTARRGAWEKLLA